MFQNSILFVKFAPENNGQRWLDLADRHICACSASAIIGIGLGSSVMRYRQTALVDMNRKFIKITRVFKIS